MHAVNEGVPPSGSIPVRVALLLALLAVASVVVELLDLVDAIHVLLTPVWGVLAVAAALPALTLGIVGTIRHSLFTEGMGWRAGASRPPPGQRGQGGGERGLGRRLARVRSPHRRPHQVSRVGLSEPPMPAITPPSKPLSDGVVSLRLWRPDDAVAVTAACQDPEIPRWTRIPAPYGEADAHEWLAGRAECWAQGTEANFAVVERDQRRAARLRRPRRGRVGRPGRRDRLLGGARPSRRQAWRGAPYACSAPGLFAMLGLYRLEITADA